MSTLSSALSYALSGLTTSAAQSALTSRNVTFARDENYSRRSADVISLPGGGAALSMVSRSIDRQLLDKVIEAGSSSAARLETVGSMNRLSAAFGDPDSPASLPGVLAALQRSLENHEADPANDVLASTAAMAAGDVARKLNSLAGEIMDVRAEADKAMAASVDRINALLDQFKIVNDAVVRGAGSSADLADNLDQRDTILKPPRSAPCRRPARR